MNKRSFPPQNQPDPYGRDRAVLHLRAFFAEIEQRERDWLAEQGIREGDSRLAPARRKGRERLEKAWREAVQRGTSPAPEEAASWYIRCLAEQLGAAGGRRPPAEGEPGGKGADAGSRAEGELVVRRLFGRCRIYHDPVSPVLQAPAQIGWEARYRNIDLVTPRRLKGRELLERTRGWWTVEPKEVADVVERYGRLIVGPGGELLVECPGPEQAEALRLALETRFQDQVLLAS